MPTVCLVKISALGILLTIMMTAVACRSAATPTVIPTPEPTPSPVGTPSATLDPEAQGLQLFAEKGCATCHGADAEGSAIAPGLPGHTGEQVRRQVRNPLGAMPRFGPEEVSDEELEELIEFITSLTSDTHQEPLDLSLSATHHWMAILALKADGVAEARHHVNHIIALVEDAEHRRQMEQVLEALDAGNIHEAEHTLEEMLAGTAEPELSLSELHLQMVLSALTVHDAEDAQHHMGHFMEVVEPPKVELAERAMEHLRAGELHEAEELVKELLESIPHRHHRHN